MTEEVTIINNNQIEEKTFVYVDGVKTFEEVKDKFKRVFGYDTPKIYKLGKKFYATLKETKDG